MTNDAKPTASLTNEPKPGSTRDFTSPAHDISWANTFPDTWEVDFASVTNETKPTATMTNEAKP